MTYVTRVQYAITTGATGTALGVQSPAGPIEGRILEWVIPVGGTAFLGPGGTATLTATRATDGGTVLALTALAASPLLVAPRRLTQTVAGGTTFFVAGSASSGVLDNQGIPCADNLNVAVTAAGSSLSGTVYMYYDRFA